MFGTIGRMEHTAVDPRPSITCPECHRTSWHPKDVEYGWCANCNTYTSGPHAAELALLRLLETS